METLEHVLSDAFVAFSLKIAEIHKAKLACKQNFAQVYQQYQADIKTFDEQAQTEIKEFEDWKKQHTKEDK